MSNVSGRLEKEMITYAKIEAKLNAQPKILYEFYTNQRASRKSYTTINVYLNNVIHFVNFMKRSGTIDEDFYKRVTPQDVESYMISLEARETSSGIKRTGDDALQQRWSSINSFFDYLEKRKYIAENPVSVIERPQNHTEHKITYLTHDEINKLMETIDCTDIYGIRDKAIISLALATALRVTAITNINLEDIDFESHCIHVIEKRQKTRSIPMGKNTEDVLKNWIDARNKTFVGLDTSALFVSRKRNRISPDAINDALKKHCDAAGISKHITAHKMRSTAACALAKADMPIKTIAKQLGHSSIAITQRYIAAFEEDQDKTTSILDNLF